MRVAFGLIGGPGWTGGLSYLVNLLSAISESGQPVEPVLFTGFDAPEDALEVLKPYLSMAPIKSDLWTSGNWYHRTRLLQAVLLQKDTLAERAFRQAGIDLVFQHSTWYGYRFSLPTLAWIADFQHKSLPQMFTLPNYWKREIGYRALAGCATRILVSSEDAKKDCERFYPVAKGRIAVMPFAIRIPAEILKEPTRPIREKYNLPEKFFFLPNQFWKHKNHLAIIEAIRLIKSAGKDIVVAVCGNPQDIRDPNHPERIFAKVAEFKLEGEFRMIGMIPYPHLISLIRASAAVINPSLFEGWSTTVEEAKSVGAPLLLSDISVHREQAAGNCRFFDPRDPQDIASVLLAAWQELPPGPRAKMESLAVSQVDARRAAFSQRFVNIAQETIKAKTYES